MRNVVYVDDIGSKEVILYIYAVDGMIFEKVVEAKTVRDTIRSIKEDGYWYREGSMVIIIEPNLLIHFEISDPYGNLKAVGTHRKLHHERIGNELKVP